MQCQRTIFVLYSELSITVSLILFSLSSEVVSQKRNGSRNSNSVQKPKENEPSLQETLDWLKKTFDSSLGTQNTIGQETHNYYTNVKNFEGCTVTWRNLESVSRNGITSLESAEEYTADLSTLDPNKVMVDNHKIYWVVQLRTTNNGADIKIKNFEAVNGKLEVVKETEESDGVGGTSIAYVHTRSEQHANRIANAFRHAIKLCGGKKEPF